MSQPFIKFLITIGPIDANKLWEVEKFCIEKDYPFKTKLPRKPRVQTAPTTTGDDLDIPGKALH